MDEVVKKVWGEKWRGREGVGSRGRTGRKGARGREGGRG